MGGCLILDDGAWSIPPSNLRMSSPPVPSISSNVGLSALRDEVLPAVYREST